nr:hypothetical protein [Tanacetum cinerariifolium]
MSFELNYSDEAKEFKRIYDELAVEYQPFTLSSISLCNLAKEVGLIVLASDKTVSPTSNCRCEELESTCNKEHSRVLNLEAEAPPTAAWIQRL